MKQKNTVNPNHVPLLNIFLNEYETLRRQMDEAYHAPLRALAPIAFCKWYATALAENTILSPANLCGTDLNRLAQGGHSFYDAAQDCVEYAYRLHLLSRQEKDAAEHLTEYRFDLHRYSTQAHPLIDDLQALLAFCTPVRTTDAGGLLLEEDAARLLEQLSLQDSYYLEYLTRLAWMQGLFVPMLSIHTNCLQPAADCDAFFAQSTAEILLRLGETACELAAERFIDAMGLEEYEISADFFLSCLQKNMYIDPIFVDFYNSFGIDIVSIWDTPVEKMDAEQHDVVGSFLYAGVMLDKWFFTPMDSFFHFIRSISFSPMDMREGINRLLEALGQGEDPHEMLFSPPAYYSLTPLGAALFPKPGADLGEDIQAVLQSIRFDEAAAVAMDKMEEQKRERAAAQQEETDILSIRLTSLLDPSFWEVFEARTDMLLHTLLRNLSLFFYPQGEMDYMLSVPDRNGFPVEYSAADSKRSVNKTNDKTLQELLPYIGQSLLFYPAPGKGIAFSLLIEGVQKGKPGLIYPRIAKRSKSAEQAELFDDEF